MNKKNIVILLIVAATIALGIGAYSVMFKDEAFEDISSGQLDASTLEVYTVTYEVNNAESISTTSGNCLVTASVCSVTTPEIKAKDGFKVIGWSTDPKATIKEYNENETITLIDNLVLYAITVENASEKEYEVGSVCTTPKNNTGVAVVDIAYSQIGYVEKASDKNLDSCTSNKGDNNYNKYGNSGNAWSEAFINWVFDKAEINLSEKGVVDVDMIDSYVTWAKSKDIWFGTKSSLHNGDIVIVDNNIGIAVKEDDTWKMISGNQDNKVKLVEFGDATGFISTKGIAY